MGIMYKLETLFGMGRSDSAGVALPAAVSTPVFLIVSEDGVLMAYGTSVPSTANTYAPGCLFIHTATTIGVYVNKGSYASPNFTLVTQA